MNDSVIRDFCITARNELREQVARRALLYGITAEGCVDSSADVVDGRVLTPEEIAQRKELIARFLVGPEESYAERYEALVERAAYTWFNRLVAIRYMEVNDHLPSHARMLSGADGSFASQAMAEALQIDIAGIDRVRVAELVSAADDEALFRYLFLTQCDELATCLPDVFEPIGSAMELLLPDGLLRRGGVACQLVENIPEFDWEDGVEIVGWMYQYYNAERKDEAFASFKKGKKAEADALAPATQLFTPDWIVRYLVENSLGRLWLQSYPDSALADSMPYYIPDEESVSSDASISSPEDISIVDPACGSGHILVYAFDLLARIYEEAGYSRREIPQLILRRNLSGIEIDPRAAALASFALAMKGCELDSRFLTRGVFPKVTTMVPVTLDEGELESLPMLAERTILLDAMAHASECGSLFASEPEDMIVLQSAKVDLESRGDLLSAGLLQKVEAMIGNCEPLARQYDVVVANPPYMGSSNMNKWLANWTKRNYPDSKRDLCTCFIERGFTLAKTGGYSATVTSSTWMFISSFETLRKKLLKDGTIISMLHTQGPNNHPDVFDANAAMVIEHSRRPDYEASYFKLNKLGLPVKEKMLLEAIADPDCGWFYRRDASAFSAIPGSPIAYWASDAMRKAFEVGVSVDTVSDFTGSQNITGDNNVYLRMPWEISRKLSERWVPYAKGGEYRRWYGNKDYLVRWDEQARLFYKTNSTSNLLQERFCFEEGITYNAITSSKPHFRYLAAEGVFDKGGPSLVRLGDNLGAILAFFNSSVAEYFLRTLNPTMNVQVKDIKLLPLLDDAMTQGVSILAQANIDASQKDYDSFETSRDFKRSPLI